MNAKQHLVENFGNPKSPVTFMGVNKLYIFYDKQIPVKEIKKFLSTQESYTLMRQKRKSKKGNYTIINFKRDQVQSDLVFVTKLASFNSDTSYLLCCIDSYTKRLWVEPLQDKTCESTMTGLKHIFERMGKLPHNFLSDRGLEFKCRLMKKLMSDYKIKQVFTKMKIKPALLREFKEPYKI